MGIATILGTISGLFIGGPIGGLIGYCLGKMIEGNDILKLENIFSTSDNNDQFKFQMSLLTLMAAVMQANGQAKRSELDFVKDYIKKAFPTEKDQRNALQLLKNLLEENIDIQGVAKQVGRQMNIYHKRELLHFLIGIAYADGMFERSEDAVIKKIAILMGVSNIDYESIKASYFADENNSGSNNRGSYSQRTSRDESSDSRSGSSSYSNSSNSGNSSSNSRSQSRPSSDMSLSTAYRLLGIDSTATNEEIVKAYRSMSKKYHPDRVATLGEGAVKDAVEQMKKINQAYDLLKHERDIR